MNEVLIPILIILIVILIVVLWIGAFIIKITSTNDDVVYAQREYDRLVELITVTGNIIREYEYSTPHKDFTEIVAYYDSKCIDLKYFILCNKQSINKHFNFEQFHKTVFK